MTHIVMHTHTLCIRLHIFVLLFIFVRPTCMQQETGHSVIILSCVHPSRGRRSFNSLFVQDESTSHLVVTVQDLRYHNCFIGFRVEKLLIFAYI